MKYKDGGIPQHDVKRDHISDNVIFKKHLSSYFRKHSFKANKNAFGLVRRSLPIWL
ncbi:MAG: hypothetical protein P8M25_10540 [Paracoccaceae bacterium]|nr:hypothetical protein [Paracoccaceae bacterium]